MVPDCDQPTSVIVVQQLKLFSHFSQLHVAELEVMSILMSVHVKSAVILQSHKSGKNYISLIIHILYCVNNPVPYTHTHIHTHLVDLLFISYLVASLTIQ